MTIPPPQPAEPDETPRNRIAATDQPGDARDLPLLAADDLTMLATALLDILGNLHHPDRLQAATYRARDAVQRLTMSLEDLDSYPHSSGKTYAHTVFAALARDRLPTTLHPHLPLHPEPPGPTHNPATGRGPTTGTAC
ncbi:hypothetical protein [Nocardia asiatica]|uniref:hypothetical protein n=1 Tax=Nocardia asiatica TaxID=209252 RepID=UPI0012FB9DD5|nr:hypothetical protein [Nocardia asiatica]